MTCPNDPPCAHPAENHDHDPLFGDGQHCRHIGCWCGHRDPDAGRELDVALLRISVEQRVVRMAPLPKFPINLNC